MSSQPVVASVTITDPLGLHLRVGKDLVKVANQYHSSITAENLSRSSPVCDVKSILQLMQLQARQGHTVRLAAAGPDAKEAIHAVVELIQSNDKTD